MSRLAMTVDGRITVCKAQFPGNGRCNHISHLKEGESVLDFIARANRENELPEGDVVRFYKDLKNALTIEEKKKLSGKFNSCKFVEESEIKELRSLIKNTSRAKHIFVDSLNKGYSVNDYENEYEGHILDIFRVDRGVGKEIHVIKNNGVIEIYNEEKLKNNQNGLISKRIARRNQLEAYFKWEDKLCPGWLRDIAFENYDKKRNIW